MQKGEFVKINYTGKVKETGEVFDRGNMIPIVIGEGFVIRGLDEALQNMEPGEKKTVELPPEKAFGVRTAELIKVLPLSEFEKNNISPRPGMFVNINGLLGRILSISSGRVRVDFNHPLAGKTIEYEVEIREKAETSEKKAEYLIEFFLRDKKFEFELSGDRIEIRIKESVPEENEKNLAEALKKYLGVKEVKISRVF